MAWQDIDSAPKDGQLIDVWVSPACGEPLGRYANVRWDGTFWAFEHDMMTLSDCGVGPYDVTHWMPRPDGPNGEPQPNEE